jgi:hypothetical protein
VLAELRAASERMSIAAGRNYKRWCSVLLWTCDLTLEEGHAVWVGHITELTEWIDARMSWMDVALEKASRKSPPAGA